VQDEQLRAAHTEASFGGARGDAERLDDAADGIEGSSEVSRILARVGRSRPANRIGGHVRLITGVLPRRVPPSRTQYTRPNEVGYAGGGLGASAAPRYWLSPGTCRYLHCRLASRVGGSRQFRSRTTMVDRRRHGVLLVICWLLSAALFVFLFITYNNTKLSYSMYFPGMPLYGAMTWWFFLTIPLIGWTWGFFNDLKDSIEPESRKGPVPPRATDDHR